MGIELWKGTAPDTELCGNQAQPSIEPYISEGSRGAVIVCPGGGYHHKAAHEGGPIAKMINEAGISAFVLDYRVLPFRLDTAIGDVQRAIRVVRSMGYEKVAVLGFSAGGHLCSMAAVKYDAGRADAEDPIERISCRPDAFIPCYGACSFSFMRTWARQVLGDPIANVQLLARYSAEAHVTADTPPAFIWHTADDTVVPVEIAFRLASALAAKGVSFEMHVYPHGPHGMGLAEADPTVHQWCGQLQRWLLGQGYGKG